MPLAYDNTLLSFSTHRAAGLRGSQSSVSIPGLTTQQLYDLRSSCPPGP